MVIEYKHWELIAHSLGVNLYHAIHSKRYKDKELPDEFYRNYFASSKGGDAYNLLIQLENEGLTKSWSQNDHIYFMVTNEGIADFREYFYKEVVRKFKKPSKSQMRYLHYLHLDFDMSFIEYLQSSYCLK